jgi:hypothetical protein
MSGSDAQVPPSSLPLQPQAEEQLEEKLLPMMLKLVYALLGRVESGQRASLLT